MMGVIFRLVTGEVREEFALMENFACEYIHGDRFKEVADWVIHEDEPFIPDEIHSENGIIFCPANNIHRLFTALEHSEHRYVLISHNGDQIIDHALWSAKPKSVVSWFAQNVSMSVPGLYPIPIGLERPHVAGGRCRPGVFESVAEHPRIIRNWLYMNHRNATNRLIRRPIYNALCWRWWVTNRTKADTPFACYLEEMYAHRFVLSPPGNGLDCHRTWEALYLGVIPVVETCLLYESFVGLPILTIKDLRKLGFHDLKNNCDRLNGLRSSPAMEMLKWSYWDTHIRRIAQQSLAG